MSRVVGIDLGTTNSCVAVIDGDAPAVIANAEGSRTTPSVLGFALSGERLVGQAARRQAMTNAENTIYAVKRLMGRKFEDPEVQRQLLTCPYEIVSAENGDAHVRVRGRDYSPPELSALVLQKMRQTAEDWLGEPVTEAVACGIETEGAQRVAVYDLGGGSFDISVRELEGGVFRVRSTVIDNQPFVNVQVLQGEREMSADNKSLAHFELTGIPPAPRGVPKIEVSFDIDADGVLSISAKDHGTARAQRITVTPATGLSETDIERLVAEGQEMADADRVCRLIADARNKGEGLLYSSEKAMEEFGALLPVDERDMMVVELAECRAALEGEDLAFVQDALARLEVSAQRIGEAIYAAADASGTSTGGGR